MTPQTQASAAAGPTDRERQPDSRTPARETRWGLGDELATVAACSALMVAWWRLPAFVPRPGGDYGWIVGMHQLRAAGLRHGVDVVFQYGPLEWLAVPSSLSRVEVGAAVALWLALGVAFLVTVQVSLRSVVSGPLAWIATVAVAPTLAIEISAPPGAVVTMALVTAVLYATRTLPARARAAFPTVAGVVAAVFVLTKFTSGLAVGLSGAAAIASLAERRVPRLVAVMLAGTITLLGLWAAFEHDVRHLVDYLLRSLEFANGYAGAMGIEGPGFAHEYALAAVVSAGLLVALVRPGARVGPWPFRLAVAVVVWSAFRQGFVRHDSHSVHFFATIGGLLVVLAVLQRSSALAVLAAVSLVAQASSMGDGIGYLDPARGVRQFAEAVTLVADRRYQHRTNEAARADVRGAQRVPEALVDAVAGRSVDIEPFEDQLAWAYGWTWRPLTSVQGYTAWTAALDEANVRALRDDATAPQVILRLARPATLDGRYKLWDPPRTQLAILCRYRLVARADAWELLERGSDRCGPKRRLGDRRYAANERIDLPDVEDGIVLATISPERSTARALAGALFKMPELYVMLDGSRWRLPWGHTGAPLVVSVPETTGFQSTPAPRGGRRLRVPYGADVQLDVVPLDP